MFIGAPLTDACASEALPLVLIAGMNLSDRLWDSCSLPDRVITIVPSGDSMDAAVDELRESLPRKFVLGGLSLGAIIAMRLVSVAPERVAGLLLMATNAKAPTEEQKEGWLASIEDLAHGLSPEGYQERFVSLLLSDHAAADGGLVQVTIGCAEDISTDVLKAQLATQLTRSDERPGLARVNAPTIVVAGTADKLCPVSNHEDIVRLVPGAALWLCPGVGHLIPLEDPAAVTRAVSSLYRLIQRPP